MQLTPVTMEEYNDELEEYENIDKTYKIDFEKNRITNIIDGIEALEQSIYCILNTERYENIIYSWNYGSEFNSLIGKDKDFILGDLKRRIVDALSVDERINDVNNFKFSTNKESMIVNFIVKTIYGEITIEQEVAI